MLTKRVKSKIAGDLGKHEKDTGSASVQVGLLGRQIDELALHLKKNPKDNHSRQGLFKMVGQRKGMLEYLRSADLTRYRALIKDLGLRK